MVCTYWCASRYDKGNPCACRGFRAMASPRTALRLLSCFSNSSNSKMRWLLWDLPSKQLCSGRSVLCSKHAPFHKYSCRLHLCMPCSSVRVLPAMLAFHHVSNQHLQHVIQMARLSKTRNSQLCGVCCSYRAQAAWPQARLGRS